MLRAIMSAAGFLMTACAFTAWCCLRVGASAERGFEGREP